MRVFTIITAALALLAVIRPQHAAHILGLFPHTGRSHQMVFEPLLLELAHRGHNVTVVSFFPLVDPPPNYKDISLRGLAPLGIETIDLSWFENQGSGFMGQFEKLSTFTPLADMATSVCQKIVDWPELREVFHKDANYDLILLENFNSDCMLGLAHAYGIPAPVIALLTSSMMPWSFDRLGVTENPAYVPSMSTHFTSTMTFTERLENTVMHYYLKYWFRYMIQIKEQNIIERHVGKKIIDLDVLSKNVTLMMVNTHHSLNGAQPMVPGLIEVGGMHLTPSQATIPIHIERFINESEHGVILFSFGSLIKTSSMPKHREELIVKVLARFPQRIIWKHEGSDRDGTITGNIFRLKWIPQRELLNHPKVIAFIAHGGLLGMLESLQAAVPMLVIPFFGDQPSNGAAAAKAGFGKVLQYNEIDEHKLYNSLQEVLSPQMRENALRLSTIWKDRPMSPLETAVYWIERTIRLGHVPNTRTPAGDLPAYQLALLDIFATIILSLTILLMILFFLLKTLVFILLAITKKIFVRKSKEKDN